MGKQKKPMDHYSRHEDGDTEGELQLEKGLRYRCAPKKLRDLAEEFNHASEKRKMIAEIGFDGLLSIKLTCLNHKLLKFLLNNFDERTCTLTIGECKATIGVNDVTEILGLNSTGPSVDCFEIDGEVEEHLWGFMSKDRTTLKMLEKLLLQSEVQSPELFKACATLYVVGTFISPTTNLHVPRSYLSVVRDVAKVSTLNWAEHLLGKLCDGISRWRNGEYTYIRGCVAFLELFYYDRVNVGNRVAPIVCRPKPQCGTWDPKTKRAVLRKVLNDGGFAQPLVSFHQIERVSRPVRKVGAQLQSEKGNETEVTALRVEVNALRVEVIALGARMDVSDKLVEELAQDCRRQFEALKDGVANLNARLDESMAHLSENIVVEVRKVIAESLGKLCTESQYKKHRNREDREQGSKERPATSTSHKQLDMHVVAGLRPSFEVAQDAKYYDLGKGGMRRKSLRLAKKDDGNKSQILSSSSVKPTCVHTSIEPHVPSAVQEVPPKRQMLTRGAVHEAKAQDKGVAGKKGCEGLSRLLGCLF